MSARACTLPLITTVLILSMTYIVDADDFDVLTTGLSGQKRSALREYKEAFRKLHNTYNNLSMMVRATETIGVESEERYTVKEYRYAARDGEFIRVEWRTVEENGARIDRDSFLPDGAFLRNRDGFVMGTAMFPGGPLVTTEVGANDSVESMMAFYTECPFAHASFSTSGAHMSYFLGAAPPPPGAPGPGRAGYRITDIVDSQGEHGLERTVLAQSGKGESMRLVFLVSKCWALSEAELTHAPSGEGVLSRREYSGESNGVPLLSRVEEWGIFDNLQRRFLKASYVVESIDVTPPPLSDFTPATVGIEMQLHNKRSLGFRILVLLLLSFVCFVIWYSLRGRQRAEAGTV